MFHASVALPCIKPATPKREPSPNGLQLDICSTLNHKVSEKVAYFSGGHGGKDGSSRSNGVESE